MTVIRVEKIITQNIVFHTCNTWSVTARNTRRYAVALKAYEDAARKNSYNILDETEYVLAYIKIKKEKKKKRKKYDHKMSYVRLSIFLTP